MGAKVHRRLVWTFIVAVLLGGCAAPTGPSSSSGSTPEGNPSADNGTVPAGSPSIGSDQRAELGQLVNCRGAGVGLDFVGLEGASQPPGWDPWYPLDGVDLFIFECARVIWGSYSRPIQFLLETHTNFTLPAACSIDSPGTTRIISKFWVNDTEVAEWLDAEFELPVAVVPHTRVERLESGIVEWTTQWTPPGSPTSSMVIRAAHAAPNTINDWGWRFFWWNETATSYLDFVVDFERNTTGPPVGIADQQEPMLNGPRRDVPAMGLGTIVHRADGTLSVSRFDDFFCGSGP
jgi:hypothetical protein